MTPQRPVRFGIIGGGWRSQFFLRAAQLLPEAFEVTSVYSRTEATRHSLAQRFGVAPVQSAEAVTTVGSPDFVLVAVPRQAAPEITALVTARKTPVLLETPPAPDLAELVKLWSTVGATGLVQVAEQSMYMPDHAATLEVVRRGTIGRPTNVQVSSNHEYHAIAIMRRLLGVAANAVTVDAHESVAPLLNPISFDGLTGDIDEVDCVTTIARLDFGGGLSGLYDFTDNQWFNPLRHRRLVTRGTRGEISDGHIISMNHGGAVVESQLSRRQTGIGMNHEGFHLDNISHGAEVLYLNPYPRVSQSDEDIAVTGILRAMGNWVLQSGPAPYSLAEGLQDQLVALALQTSVAVRGAITTQIQPWAEEMTKE